MRKALVRVVVLIVLAALVVGGAWLWMRRPWRVVATVNGVSLTASELDLRAKALGGDLRETARTWIAKEVLLGEAVQRGVSVAEEDERATTDILASWFAAHGMTAERFFKEGPIPEQARRQDLKEGLLINALVKEGLRTASFPDFYHSLRDKAQVRCPEFPELERIDTGTPLYAGMWGWRPSRVAAVAAGQVVTAAELDLRVQNARDDLRRMGRAQPDERALRRREMQVWIVKAVMRAEADRRGFAVTSDDEKSRMSQMAAALKPHGLTVAQFFKEGVLPEGLKWDDVRSAIRIDKFLERDRGDKLNVTTQEIEARMAELRERAAKESARGGKAKIRSDRKTAIDQLRRERYLKEYRTMFRSLFATARVWCPEFPDMENVDGVSVPLASEKGSPR